MGCTTPLIVMLSQIFLNTLGYNELPEFSNKIVFNSRLEVHYGCQITFEKCQKLCSVHPSCRSFFFNEESLRCQLHTQTFTVGDMDTLVMMNDTGWKYDIEPCNRYLIAESSTDINSLITVSSAFRCCTTKDKYKINSTEGDRDLGQAGAWRRENNDSNAFVAASFNTMHSVVGVATQGREAGPHYVTEYNVYYSKTGMQGGETDGKTYHGNTDGTTVVINYFDSPLTGTVFSIVPRKYVAFMSMRFDFIGFSL